MNMESSAVVAPPAPKRIEDMGLPLVFMRDIVLKTIFRKNANTVSLLAKATCLPIGVAKELIDAARTQGLLEAMGTLSATAAGNEMSYQLTDSGKARSLDALAQSEYFGAMPVPLEAYREQVERQSIRNVQITREQLVGAMGHLVLPDQLIAHLGPAVGSGRSILMYGPPGNGKSSISNGIRDAMGDRIYVPRAIEYSGQVISVYDPIVHSAAEDSAQQTSGLRRTNRYDMRYVLCDRPTVITGGELSLNMLDLVYNPTARTYQAPLQFKSTGGIFIVDDLGRQAEPPQKLVNRWIVPLEENKDILALQSGEKFEVPFDTLVIFSTNFHPNEIFDKAALRRIFFKIKIDGPSQEDFLKIFALVARKKKMQLDEASLVHLLKNKYPTIDNVYANYQPVFLIDQMIAVCDFEGWPYRMTPELVDRAWANMFVKDEVIVK
ncbi:ATPase [Salipiger mucosus]|uniref:Putative ATPase with chaperone activity, associated with Flp pilus assembly n=1 Tax=Salipiger mucosus DSM 16094 TaxID=1123237 RepID=S9RXU9_9RHOB|nr:ATPase [Salipiger mucosus]EPX78814.1 putative ATPase with chaperone activity, associated with Flp pilus assembly [Salipiger mucosus DSM 16094]